MGRGRGAGNSTTEQQELASLERHTWQNQLIGLPRLRSLNAEMHGIPKMSGVTDWASNQVSYGYDDAGRKSSQSNPNGTSTTYSYDGLNRLRTVNYPVVGGLPHILIESMGGQDTLYVYGQGLTFEVKPDGSHRYYHSDALGSTRVATDDAGNPVSAYNYDAYGSVRAQAGEGRSFTYTGEQLDSETSMVFLRARYYGPYLSRFIQADSIAPDFSKTQALDCYSYVGNNPVRYTDPSGHCVEDACVGELSVLTFPVWAPYAVAAGVAVGGAVVVAKDWIADRLTDAGSAIRQTREPCADSAELAGDVMASKSVVPWPKDKPLPKTGPRSYVPPKHAEKQGKVVKDSSGAYEDADGNRWE